MNESFLKSTQNNCNNQNNTMTSNFTKEKDQLNLTQENANKFKTLI